jgi:hypothetical protein
VAAVKGSLRMRQVLERAARQMYPGAPRELRLLYRGALLRLDAAALDRVWQKAVPKGARRNEMRRVGFNAIFDALWAEARSQRIGGLPAKPDFEDELADRNDFREFLKVWYPRLKPEHVLAWLADPQRLRGYATGILSRHEIELLTGTIDPRHPTVADLALLDELDELIGRPPKPRRRKNGNPFHVMDGVQEVSTHADRQRAARAQSTQRDEDYREYAHVVVDEAQDVTPMQWRMLGRRGRFASWTIVGDPAQTAWTGDVAELDRSRDKALGTRMRATYTLSTNYRNSAEIFAVAAAVIRAAMPDLVVPVAVRSTGVEPVDLVVPATRLADSVRETAEKLLAEVDGTVGVITPVPRRDEVASWVAGLPDRLQVVTSLQAKGMEYDAVVLVEPKAIRTESPSGVRTLYVALSRATQRLVTLGTDAAWRP